jgi:hypothetical protein
MPLLFRDNFYVLISPGRTFVAAPSRLPNRPGLAIMTGRILSGRCTCTPAQCPTIFGSLAAGKKQITCQITSEMQIKLGSRYAGVWNGVSDSLLLRPEWAAGKGRSRSCHNITTEIRDKRKKVGGFVEFATIFRSPNCHLITKIIKFIGDPIISLDFFVHYVTFFNIRRNFSYSALELNL